MKIVGANHPNFLNETLHSFKVYSTKRGCVYICSECDIELSPGRDFWKFRFERNFQMQLAKYKFENMPKTCGEAKMMNALD